jgi:diguanylate cyclase
VAEALDQRRFLRAAGAAALATALFAAWIATGAGGERTVLYMDDLGTTLAALAAALLCFRAGADQHGRRRVFWWLLAAACGAWTLGEATWSYYDVVLQRAVPTPSWADVGYLTGPLLAVCGLLAHPAMAGRKRHTLRSLLDAIAVATALLFLSWTFILGPLARSTDLSTGGGLVTLAYPFADVLMIFFVVTVVRRITSEARIALWCLLGGLLLMAFSDSLYAYLAEVKSYSSGNLLDAGWVASYLAIAVAAYCSNDRGGLAERTRNRSLVPLVAPFFALIAALTALAVKTQLGQRPDDASLYMAFALVGLVLTRQMLLLTDLIESGEDATGSLFDRLYAALERAEPEPEVPR